ANDTTSKEIGQTMSRCIFTSGMFVIPFTRLGITNSWGGWSIIGGTIRDPGIWSYEGVAGTHIVFSSLCFLVAIWDWVYWDLEIFCDERLGKSCLDLPKICNGMW
ncbi:hypothetical protein Droror1_Dr00000293, partial [Drosera rotundifolia]